MGSGELSPERTDTVVMECMGSNPALTGTQTSVPQFPWLHNKDSNC